MNKNLTSFNLVDMYLDECSNNTIEFQIEAEPMVFKVHRRTLFWFFYK